MFFTLLISFVGYKPQDIRIAEHWNTPLNIILIDDNLLEEVVVTARRRSETVQKVPIPISVVAGTAVEEAGAFNVNRVK